MKHSPWLSYLILFSLFFPVGFWAGNQLSLRNRKLIFPAEFKSFSFQTKRTIYPLPSEPRPNQLGDPNSLRGENTQTNTLILFVDDLRVQQPKLTSAWLLIQPKDSFRLIFLPIFQENNTDPELTTAFQLDGKQLSKRFVKAIEKRNLLWHFFIVLDQTAQKHLLANAELYPDNRFIPSNAVLDWVCKDLPLHPQSINVLIPLISVHLIANIDLEASLGIWQHHLSTQPSLMCEFPTLSK
ncbi:MAG: hypothetical protein N3D16_04045 [Anaerolineales bacterium]|nr:hypothetical protein [Anaerolineales bacterium]